MMTNTPMGPGFFIFFHSGGGAPPNVVKTVFVDDVEEEEQEDWFEEDIKKALKPKKKLKLHTVDYINIEQEISNIEAIIENEKLNKDIKKRKQRRKAFNMLLKELL